MQERIDPIAYDPQRFFDDISRAARRIDAPFDPEITGRALRVFEPELRTCVVQLKATCKPGSGVYYRFFYKGPEDLTRRAQAEGLLPAGDGPNLRLQSEVLAAFAGATRAGLDLDSGFGLAKVWTFTGGPVPVAEVLKLPAIPDSARRHAEFFAAHGLNQTFFVASDYQGETMNLYFGWEDGCRNREWIEAMVAATGGAAPSPELCQEILSSQAASGGVGMTFSWDRPEVLRWCLYSLEVADPLKLSLPARLQRFVAAPSLNLSPQFNVAWSFGGSQTYLKLEKSYARDATFFLTHEMGGDLSHPAAVLG